MSILITGGVGSGTTFIARMFQELGFDLGDSTHMENKRNKEGDQVRGVEHDPLLKLVSEWNWRLMPIISPKEVSHMSRNSPLVLRLDDPEFAKTQRDDVKKVSDGLPNVVKQPLMARYLGLWILAGGKIPDYVVVCMRDTYDQARSNVRDGFASENVFHDRQDTLTNYGMLWETLHRYDIKHDVVEFPRCVRDSGYLCGTINWDSLGMDFVKVTRAWRKIADPRKIQTRDREEARKKDLDGHEVRQQLHLGKIGALFDVFAGQRDGEPIRDFVVVKGA